MQGLFGKLGEAVESAYGDPMFHLGLGLMARPNQRFGQALSGSFNDYANWQGQNQVLQMNQAEEQRRQQAQLAAQQQAMAAQQQAQAQARALQGMGINPNLPEDVIGEMVKAGFKAPSTTGGMQWDAATRTWKPIPGWQPGMQVTNAPQFTSTTGENYAKKLGAGVAEQTIKDYDLAKGAVTGIDTIHQARQLLDSPDGMITGFGADFRTGFGKALMTAGIDVGQGDAIANTEAYSALMGREVAELIKAFGAGTGLSDADREFATKMAGGTVALTKESLRRILAINERARRNIIKRHNYKAKAVMNSAYGAALPYSIMVDMPPEYTPPGAKQTLKTGLPEGIPKGSRQIGTSKGIPVYETPDGKRLIVE